MKFSERAIYIILILIITILSLYEKQIYVKNSLQSKELFRNKVLIANNLRRTEYLSEAFKLNPSQLLINGNQDTVTLFANSGLSPKGLEGTVQDFSNLDNARGLFSSLSTIQVNALFLSNQSIDTIALNSVTKPLNFLKSHEEF